MRSGWLEANDLASEHGLLEFRVANGIHTNAVIVISTLVSRVQGGGPGLALPGMTFVLSSLIGDFTRACA